MYVNNKEDIVVVFFKYQVETNSATTVVPGDKTPTKNRHSCSPSFTLHYTKKSEGKLGRLPLENTTAGILRETNWQGVPHKKDPWEKSLI